MIRGRLNDGETVALKFDAVCILDTYKTDNLALSRADNQTSNSKGHSRHKSELSDFQHRCIHAIADMLASPSTVLPTSTGVFLRSDGTRKNAFNKQLSGKRPAYSIASFYTTAG